MRTLLILLVLLSACKAKQEVAAEEPSSTEQAPVESISAPVEPWSEFSSKEAYEDFQVQQARQKMMQEMGIAHPVWPDSVIIGLERTACFGTCPSFKFSVSKNGYADYTGYAFVKNEGKYTAKVSQEVIQTILKAADNINYFDLEEFYWEAVTDVPTSFSIIKKDQRVKQVLNQWESPQELENFENYIEEVSADLNWKKTKE